MAQRTWCLEFRGQGASTPSTVQKWGQGTGWAIEWAEFLVHRSLFSYYSSHRRCWRRRRCHQLAAAWVLAGSSPLLGAPACRRRAQAGGLRVHGAAAAVEAVCPWRSGRLPHRQRAQGLVRSRVWMLDSRASTLSSLACGGRGWARSDGRRWAWVQGQRAAHCVLPRFHPKHSQAQWSDAAHLDALQPRDGLLGHRLLHGGRPGGRLQPRQHACRSHGDEPAQRAHQERIGAGDAPVEHRPATR